MEPQICIFTFEITLVCKDFTQKLQVPAYLKIFKGSDCEKNAYFANFNALFHICLLKLRTLKNTVSSKSLNYVQVKFYNQ